MLLKTHSLMRGLSLLAGLALAVPAFAQTAGSPPDKPVSIDVNTPYLDEAKLDPAALAAAKAQGESMVRDMLKSYSTLKPEGVAEDTLRLKAKFDDIADEAMAKERTKVMEFLGIDSHRSTGLYYFVSWSMPLEMLRAYAVEAMWSGAALVFKGVPPGKELGKFVINDLRQLVYGKGAAANVSIDPRLFDAYSITAVPAIVFTIVKANMQCQGVNPVSVQAGDVKASYDTCPELDPATYWKVSGAVTSNYALNAFIDSGAVQAKPYAAALAKGLAIGATSAKEQTPFAGDWKDAISPSELLAAQEAAKSMTTPVPPQTNTVP